MTNATNAEVYEVYEKELTGLCAMRESIVEHPEKDFMRQTVLTIPCVISMVVSFGAESLKPSAADFFRQCRDWPDGKDARMYPAIIMAREKLKAMAFELLYRNVSSALTKTFTSEPDPESGYLLLPRAVDGTAFPYDSSSEYSDDSCSAKVTRSWGQECTAICDLTMNIFTGAVVHGVHGKGTGEPSDFVTMIDRAEIPNGTKILYLADKAYAVPNVLAHRRKAVSSSWFGTRMLTRMGSSAVCGCP